MLTRENLLNIWYYLNTAKSNYKFEMKETEKWSWLDEKEKKPLIKNDIKHIKELDQLIEIIDQELHGNHSK